ncbi:MAG: phosphate ABC transporter ATP-binding protein PstB [Candidatus Dormibacteria bacterium]
MSNAPISARLGAVAAERVDEADEVIPAPAVTLRDVGVSFGHVQAVRGVSLDIPSGRITGIIGPSGCGKTTLLRALNRMHDTVAGARVSGSIRLGDIDVCAASTDPVLIRTRVGMVFQRPNPFPTLSIYDNVVSGLRLNGLRKKAILDDAAEQALRAAALWDRVSPRLRGSARSLSGGEQQRLCIARALAVEPEVLLMDEPTSALDPIATTRIEELLATLSSKVTIVIVTHNLQQAARVSDYCAFMLIGEDRAGTLIESGPTVRMFDKPADQRTEDYITGRFG